MGWPCSVQGQQEVFITFFDSSPASNYFLSMRIINMEVFYESRIIDNREWRIDLLNLS